MLEFCPVCKGLLQLKKDGDKNIGYCPLCGFKRMSGIEITSVDKNVNKNTTGEGVVKEEYTSVEVDRICEVCGNDKATVAEIQSNESTIFIYTCTKCNAVKRETQGTSKF